MWVLTSHSKPQTQCMSGSFQVASFCQVGFYIHSCSPLIYESSWFSQYSNLLGSCQSKSIQWQSHRSEESYTPLPRNQCLLQFKWKNQCWGIKASAEQLKQIWADMKPSAINSHQQKLSVAALLTVITMLWTLYIEPHTQTLYIFIAAEEWTAASCAERKRSRKKTLSKKNRMWDTEKSFWEKSGAGGLERKLRRKHISVKMAQVFNIISALYCEDVCSSPTHPDTYLCSLPILPTVLSDQSHITGGVCAQTTPISHIPLWKLQQTSPEMDRYPLWGVIYLSCSVPAFLFLLLYKNSHMDTLLHGK